MKPENKSENPFDEIWTVEPQRQNRFSSAWWFFYLFPEVKDGYGSEQLMVSLMANNNKKAKFNGMEVDPMNVTCEEDGTERFNSAIDAWHWKEGRTTQILKDDFRVEIKPEKVLQTGVNSEKHEKELKMESISGKNAIKVEVENLDSSLRFEVHNNSEYTEDWPKETYDTTKFGFGANDIDWTRTEFEGELEINGEEKEISGVSYFARVCLHIPLLPWRWIYTVFPNGDVFIAFIPYLGLQHLRRKYKYSSIQSLENLTYPISNSGTWVKAETGETLEFDEVKIKFLEEGEKTPNFKIKASKKGEGEISFKTETKDCIKNLMEKPLLFGLTEDKYFYNQYPFDVKNFSSNVEKIQLENPQKAHGTLEYSWGQWL